MELLIQPEDGLAPVVKAIDSARKSVEIAIFRCDRGELEKALANAAARRISVHALIASTNRNGEKELRELEMRLLAAGVTVARTASDLVRYHDKFLIVDRRKLYVLAFNFTYLDIRHSRSFGVSTTNRSLVQEAVKLFEADLSRQPYTSGVPNFLVSPVNARKELASLIGKARKDLLIYDPALTDPAMLRAIEDRAAAGVEVRIIGRTARKMTGVSVRKLTGMRLHTRTIVRDGRRAFVGSQSLRSMELDARRELGVVVRDAKVVSRLAETFQADWETAGQPAARRTDEQVEPAARVAKKVAKAVSQELPPVAPVLDAVLQEVGSGNGLRVDTGKVEEAVQEAVKDAVKEAVRDVVEDTVERADAPGGKRG